MELHQPAAVRQVLRHNFAHCLLQLPVQPHGRGDISGTQAPVDLRPSSRNPRLCPALRRDSFRALLWKHFDPALVQSAMQALWREGPG